MSLSFWFWVIYVIAILFHAYRVRWAFFDSIVFWVLIGLLGIGVFGGPVK